MVSSKTAEGDSVVQRRVTQAARSRVTEFRTCGQSTSSWYATYRILEFSRTVLPGGVHGTYGRCRDDIGSTISLVFLIFPSMATGLPRSFPTSAIRGRVRVLGETRTDVSRYRDTHSEVDGDAGAGPGGGRATADAVPGGDRRREGTALQIRLLIQSEVHTDTGRDMRHRTGLARRGFLDSVVHDVTLWDT